jgi:hypothetical protein
MPSSRPQAPFSHSIARRASAAPRLGLWRLSRPATTATTAATTAAATAPKLTRMTGAKASGTAVAASSQISQRRCRLASNCTAHNAKTSTA